MSAIVSTPIAAEAKNAPTSARLFFLDLSAGRILARAAVGGVDLIKAQPGTYVIPRCGRRHGCIGVNTKI